jgi:hypothetical protein
MLAHLVKQAGQEGFGLAEQIHSQTPGCRAGAVPATAMSL